MSIMMVAMSGCQSSSAASLDYEQHYKTTGIPTDCSICCIVDLTFNATDKKVPSKKTQAMIVPSDASENILFLKIFLVPSLIPYKNLLNIIEPPSFILLYLSIFDLDNSFSHLIHKFTIMCNNQYCCSFLIDL